MEVYIIYYTIYRFNLPVKLKLYLYNVFLAASLYQVVLEREEWKEKWRHASGAE